MFRKSIIVAGLLATTSANAFFSVEEFFKLYESPDQNGRTVAELYVGGVMEAIWAVNTLGKVSAPDVAICFPKNQEFHTAELTQIGLLALQKARRTPPKLANGEKMPMVLPLINELVDMYPCADKR